MPTVTIAKGKGYARHNDRTLQNKSIEKRTWDSNLSYRNIIYKNESLETAYEEIFGTALAKYNQKQKRSDRKIKNYLEHIKRSKQEKPVYEFIIQIGNLDDKKSTDFHLIQKCLDDYNRSFQNRNPNFRVVQQITHRDEKGMDHTHIMFVPYSTGNKQGLETKNSFSGALKEMGYGRNGFDKWREAELNEIKELMHSYCLDFELGDNRQEHLNVKQYREYKKYESKTLEAQKTLSDVHKCVLSHENNLNELKLAESEIDAQIAQKQAQIQNLEEKRVALQTNPKKIITENAHIQQIVDEFNETYLNQKVMCHAEYANDYVDKHDDRALVEPIDDQDVTIKNPMFGGEPIVQMPLSKWKQVKQKHNKVIDALNDLRKKFFLGVEKLNSLFSIAKREPEYVNAVDYQKQITQQNSKINELETRIENITNTNTSYLKEIYKLEKQLNDCDNDCQIIAILCNALKNTEIDENISLFDYALEKVDEISKYPLLDSDLEHIDNLIYDLFGDEQEISSRDYDLEL